MKLSSKSWFGCLTFNLLLLVAVLCQRPLAQLFADRFGNRIISASQGAVADPKLFFQHRFQDAAILGFLAIAAGLLHVGITRGLCGATQTRNRRWIVHSLSAFFLLNVWLALAMRTGLF